MGQGGQAGSHRFDRPRGLRPFAPQPRDWTQRISLRDRVPLLLRSTCRNHGPQHVRCHDPLSHIDAADTGCERDRATPRDDLLDRLVLDEAITSLHAPLHIDAAPGKPDRDRIGLRVRGRIEPVRHRQDLLRHTLQQGREPTGPNIRGVCLDDISSRRHISRWTPTRRRSPCHAQYLLLLLFARLAYV